MSASPWWKKELAVRRRPRGTVVVAKPVIAPGLVERAAEIFELPPEPAPAVAAPVLRSVEPADAPALPPVWPRALVDAPPVTTPRVVPVALELVPAPEPEPDPEPEPELPPAAVLLPPFAFPEPAPVETTEPVPVTPPPVTPLFASASEPEPEPAPAVDVPPEPEPVVDAQPESAKKKQPLLKREFSLPRRKPKRKRGPGTSRRRLVA